jgi:hypothetical protein
MKWSLNQAHSSSIRAPEPVYEFLKRNHGRKLREVMEAEIDISDVIH